MEALDILSADVDDEVHVGLQRARRDEVRHGLHQPRVHAEGVLHQLLAVAGGRATRDGDLRIALVDAVDELPDHRDRVALVGPVPVHQQLAVLGHQHGLDRGGAGVHAQIGPARIRGRIAARHGGQTVALQERIVRLPALEQRPVGVIVARTPALGEAPDQLIHGQRAALAGERRAQCHVIQRIARADALRLQLAVKLVSQLGEERHGAAQVHDVAPDLPSLRQARDGLVDHGREDATADVLLARTLVDQRLNVRLGKHAAATGDGIGALAVLGHFVHVHRRGVQKRRHLIDERAGAARAGAVHAHLQPTGEEQDFGVLTAQLDGHVRVRDILFHRQA